MRLPLVACLVAFSTLTYAAQPTGQPGPLAPAARVPELTPCDKLRIATADFRDYTNSLYGYGVGKALSGLDYTQRLLPPDSPLQSFLTQLAAANIIGGGMVINLQQQVLDTNYRNTCEAPAS